MPPIRTMSSVKPVKTERTHEENQERAYIAASRRSDRSLEARVESARRASEIHKRRTGRSLRVTEQDVVNEEMYEEEDDDLPMQYRRLTAHLQTQNADFDRRLQAYLTNHVAMRTALGQAVSDAWQSNNQGQQGQQGQQGSPSPHFQPGNQFMNPGMMSMPPQGYQQAPMMPPQQLYNRMPGNHRQSPYPLPVQPMQNQNMQPMRPTWQNQSPSAAAPAAYRQQQQSRPQSVLSSPVQPVKMDVRRTSLPRTPQSGHQQAGTPEHRSSVVSRSSSSSDLGHRNTKSIQSPQQVPTPPQQPLQYQRPRHQQQQYQQQPMSSPFYAGFDHAMNSGFDPTSMTLPLDAQQLLTGSSVLNMNDPMTQMFMPDQTPQMAPQQHDLKPQQQFYSYNPNARFKSNPPQHIYEGLSQTLAPGCLDTSVGGLDASTSIPHSAGSEYQLNAPFNPAGLDMGYGAGYGLGDGSVNTSGHVTPVDTEDWSNMLHDNLFTDQLV
ncbi:hypothetical protein LTR08_005696 [Meristemomyces frigidus]|nr:hypothetical protein LTR08_005696 [Meristemomyces frigidus]